MSAAVFLTGGSTDGSVLYNYEVRDECMSPLLTCVKEDKCVSVTSGKHGVTGCNTGSLLY